MARVLPHRDERAVAPIIAEILLVAITVTISGVVYVTANNFALQAKAPSGPYTALSSVRVDNGMATLTVLATSRSVLPGNYDVNLAVAGLMGKATGLPVAGVPATVTVSGTAYQIQWTDVGNTGSLAQGDLITIRAASGTLPAESSFTFYLLWSDGSVVASASWMT